MQQYVPNLFLHHIGIELEEHRLVLPPTPRCCRCLEIGLICVYNDNEELTFTMPELYQRLILLFLYQD